MNKRSLLISGFIALTFIITNSCTEATKEKKEKAFTDKQLGQMLVIGFKGSSIHAESPIVQDIKQRNIGGMILYNYDHLGDSIGRNIESPDQLLKLNSALVGYSMNPPIISIGQDGSKESPLYNLYPDWKRIFSNPILPDSLEIVEIARKFAQEFMVLGLNTNLHPRLDLNIKTTNASSPGLISSDPQKVVSTSKIILDEYDTEKLLSVPKYFPGYTPDYDQADSVNDITAIWSDDFLIPYKELFQSRTIRAIQTSHSLNGNIDPEWPGTFSSHTINELLRDSLGFEGVVFSDDLQKPIISTHYNLETVIERSINAGVDILVFGNNFEYDEDIAKKAIATMQKLLDEGRIKPEMIEAALARVDKLKQDVIAELCTCLN